MHGAQHLTGHPRDRSHLMSHRPHDTHTIVHMFEQQDRAVNVFQ